MPETLTSPLLEAATETFESLAYLFAEPGITDDIPGEDVEGVVAFEARVRRAIIDRRCVVRPDVC